MLRSVAMRAAALRLSTLLVVAHNLPYNMVLCFPSYRLHVPNGLKVPCPPGAAGCRTGDSGTSVTSVCFGLGHNTCQGADFPLNPFGEAMQNAGFKWTAELCNADSDNDGHTNGEELGDPCCEWTQGDQPSEYMLTFAPSHPGMQNHSQGTSYTRPSCGTATAPTWRSPKLATFNPWEEQRHVDFRIKNYSIPDKDTTYVDFIFNLDDTTHSLFHIVYGEAIVDQPKHLHHYVVTGCTKKIAAHLEGKPVLESRYLADCNIPVGGYACWAPGLARMWSSPAYAGVPIGTGVGIVGFSVNVHYTDGHLYPGSVSQDGFRIYYTPTLRNVTVDADIVIGIGYKRGMYIPPQKQRHFITRSCKVQPGCADVSDDAVYRYLRMTCKVAAFFCDSPEMGHYARYYCPQSCKVPHCMNQDLNAEIPVIGAYFHAHLLGTEMYQTVVRDGKRIDLGSQSVWNYDDQAQFSLLSQNLTIKPGDTIQSTCIFNSMGRESRTPIGYDTVDEMCITVVNTARSTGINVPARNFRCEGNFWAGELKVEDDGHNVDLLYPLETSNEVWRGELDGHIGKKMIVDKFVDAGTGANSYNMSSRATRYSHDASAFQAIFLLLFAQVVIPFAAQA